MNKTQTNYRSLLAGIALGSTMLLVGLAANCTPLAADDSTAIYDNFVSFYDIYNASDEMVDWVLSLEPDERDQVLEWHVEMRETGYAAKERKQMLEWYKAMQESGKDAQQIFALFFESFQHDPTRR